MIAALLLAAVFPAAGAPQNDAATAPVIAAIRVHGNHVTADDEVIRLSGLAVGAPFDRSLLETTRRTLEATHRFDDVDVLERYASITDPSRILVMIVVNEGPVRIETPRVPGAPVTVVRRRGITKNLMFLPIIDAEDGYGATYGVRFAFAGVAGQRSRLSFPLTWGGTKQAAAELDRSFTSGPFTRLAGGVGVDRRRNPAFDEDDDRTRVWARAERRAGPLRGIARGGWERIAFAELDDTVVSIGGDAIVDTRVDPIFPRNAVYGSASWTALRFADAGVTHRTGLEGEAYLGLPWQMVLAARADRTDADRPLPPYFKTLVGGWSSLRGFRAGAFTGDTATTASLELRVPLSSPLRVSRFGVSLFSDAGKAYDKGQRFQDVPWQVGIGGGVWWTAAVFRIGGSVAHGRGATTRANFGLGLEF
jgi:outer membrane protein assembly factor BamA